MDLIKVASEGSTSIVVQHTQEVDAEAARGLAAAFWSMNLQMLWPDLPDLLLPPDDETQNERVEREKVHYKAYSACEPAAQAHVLECIQGGVPIVGLYVLPANLATMKFVLEKFGFTIEEMALTASTA